MMPLLSIITPVFNTQETLPACLDSVLGQTVTDIEVLCVDDGSTDDSLSVLRCYAQADARVRILRHERNRGVSCARNTGIEAAAGEYMAFVDSDDALAPDFCERLFTAARREGADIAKGNYAYLGHSGINYSINAKIRQDKNNFYIQFCSAIYRSTFLREHGLRFPERLHASEDLVFAFSAALRAERMALDDAAHALITPRRGSASFSAPDVRTIISHYRALGMVLDQATRRNAAPACFNYVLASLFALFMHIAIRNRKPAVRKLIAVKNRQLYRRAKACPAFDADIFTDNLAEDDKSLCTCLENDNLPLFFTAMDKLQARRCRMIRSRFL